MDRPNFPMSEAIRKYPKTFEHLQVHSQCVEVAFAMADTPACILISFESVLSGKGVEKPRSEEKNYEGFVSGIFHG